ncbi:MAG TPA: hypothetical protein VMH91_02385 [Candidatus Paceibacterota bacterium]|nr:hypothetical protein [Candidatus Paceibacterota bacterium]
MAKNKKRRERTTLTTEEKHLKATQALFVLQARQLDMPNKEIRAILKCDQADVDSIALFVNKALKKTAKRKKQ